MNLTRLEDLGFSLVVADESETFNRSVLKLAKSSVMCPLSRALNSIYLVFQPDSDLQL